MFTVIFVFAEYEPVSYVYTYGMILKIVLALALLCVRVEHMCECLCIYFWWILMHFVQFVYTRNMMGSTFHKNNDAKCGNSWNWMNPELHRIAKAGMHVTWAAVLIFKWAGYSVLQFVAVSNWRRIQNAKHKSHISLFFFIFICSFYHFLHSSSTSHTNTHHEMNNFFLNRNTCINQPTNQRNTQIG